MVAAIALFRTLIETTDIASARLRIKWPNDLIAKRAGDWFKIAGILLERQDQLIVLGFGVNLAQAPDLPQRKTICAAQFGQVPDPTFFCLALERHFAVELTRWRQRGLADIGRRWLDRAHPVGTQLTVHTSVNETITGSFDGIEPDGALRLTLDDGSLEVVRAGDVEL
jgi:BirA family biotin operon repressor/biotin-[acetyl-CoA-carboxylase] ligase